jgi:hypothetical protein
MEEYFLESPIGVLAYWIWEKMASTRLNTDVPTSGRPLQHTDINLDERKSTAVDNCVLIGPDQQVYPEAPTREHLPRTEAQRWSLTKRILVAGVISLYT